MGKIRRFLGIFVFLFITAATCNVHAAGYTCDSVIQYTACNTGYFPSECGDYKHFGQMVTAFPGGTCRPCPEGYTCRGANLQCPTPIYTVTYTANGGTGSEQTQDVEYNAEFTTKPSTTFTHTGYTFAGWGGEYPESNTSYTYTTRRDTTLNAQWCQNCATVPHGTCSLTVDEKSGACKYTTRCDEGYTISGDGTATPTCTENRYTIKYTANGGTGSEQTQDVEYNAEFTTKPSTTFTHTGYTFAGWGGEYPESNTSYTYTTKGNTTLNAQWCQNCATVPHGTCSLTVDEKSGACKYTTRCDEGYTISGDGTATPTCTATCIAITLNNTKNGGTGGTETIYKKVGDTALYSDPTCTETMTLTKPTKTNATYGGHYTAATDGTQCITDAGTWVSSCNPTSATTYYAQYDCNPDWREAGTRIDGTCIGTITATAAVKKLAYTGSAQSCANVSVTKPSSGATVTYSTASNGTYNTTITQTNPGSYTIYYKVTATNYAEKTGEYICTINRVVVNPTDGSITYRPDTASTTTTVTTNTGGGAITATSNNANITTAVNGTTITITSNGNVISSPTRITVTSAGTGNYTAATTIYTLNSVTCGDGYYNKNGTCTVCPENATACGGTSNPTTFTCAAGYQTNVAGDACEPAEYTVTYNCGTGTGTAPTETTNPKYKASYTPRANTCTKAGYNFAGWSVSGTSDDIRPAGTPFTWQYLENKTFTAQWDAIGNYTATYSCGDGSGTAPAKDTNITFNSDYTIKTNGANNCTRTGYNFAGWSDGSATVQPGNIKWTYTTSKTFTAQWAPKCLAITVNSQSATTNAAPTPVYLKYATGWYSDSGCTTGLSAFTTKVARTGYAFGGFYTSTNGGGTQVVNATGNGTFLTSATALQAYSAAGTMYAKWTANTYTISYELNSGTQATTASTVPTSYTYGVGATISGQPTRVGYLFDAWCTNSGLTEGCSKTQTISTTATGNKTYYAKWANCPANATCPGNNDFTCPENYIKNAEARTCTLGTLDCVAGKYYPGTGTSMVDCSANDGYYCPGTGKTGIDGGVGCRVACPTSANGGILTTSADKATLITQCRESLTGVQIPKNDPAKTGTANTICEYTSGTENGTAVYEKDCSFTVTSCIAGYYVPVKSQSPYSKQGTCEKVGKGHYRAAGTCNANPTETNDTCMYSTCPTDGTTASETSGLITDCYISCVTEPIKDGSTTVGSRTPVNATLNYSGSAYPACTYNLTCATGYDKQAEGTANATCVPHIATVTLDHNGGTGGTTGPIYAKYNHGWYSNSGATTSLTTVNVPTKTNYTFGGYKDADNNKIINADGTFVESIPTLTANTALTAIWQGIPITCVSGKYYTGTGTTMAPCRTGEYCPGEGAPELEQAYQGVAGCFIKCPKSALNGTLSSDTSDGTGATSINQCRESLTGVQIPKNDPVKTGTANTVCKYTSGTNGTAVYEKDCSFTVTSCIGGYYVPVKTESPYSKQGTCEEVGKGYYRAAGTCNANPTSTNDTCMRTECPTGGTTAGITSTNANACFKECQTESIIKDGNTIGVRNPVTDAQGNSHAALIEGTQNYAACYYNASCADGYVAQPENSTTGSTDATCVVGEGWSVTYNGESTDYILTGNPIRNFTVATIDRTLPTADNVIRTGYTFAGWYENANLTGAQLTSIPTDRLSALTLYAKWTPKTYPVTVNSNNGTANTTIYMKYATGWYSDAATNNKLTRLDIPNGSGDEFGGYYYNNTVEVVNAGGAFVTNTLEPADNMIIVAKWLSQPITCPAGTYYPGTGDISNCKQCESGYYCEGTTKCNSNDGQNYCGRTECPGHAVTPANIMSQTCATAKTQCIKIDVTYTSDTKHVRSGTASCPANADGAYNYDATKCTNHSVTACVAGYYHGTSTAADACEAVGKGYWSNGTGTDREQCGTGTIHTYAADGVEPTISVARGTTTGTTSTGATDCFLALVPFTPTGAHGKGTQTCKWNGFGNYDESCTAQVIRFCDGGYYRKKATDTACVPAGADRYSTEGSLISEQCPARTDADGNVKNGETALSAETASGKVETATNPGACMLRVPYDVPHGTGTKLCEFNEDSVDQATGEKGQYDKNCSDREITSCEGGYYRPAGETNACVVVGQNYYRAAGKCTGSGSNDTCMRIACPSNGLTVGTVNTTVTECYKTGLSYTSTDNHVTAGTQTCSATAASQYTSNCREFNITKCAAGYYHGTSTAADACEAVGKGYWSNGTGTDREQCGTGTIHTYAADGVEPTISVARGTTTGTTSTGATDCFLALVPFTPTGAHGKGTQTCKWNGFTSYSSDCTGKQIRYCDAGYYRVDADAQTCEPAGMNHYSTEGALDNEICPARADATGVIKNGETSTTTATSPTACMLRVPYDVPHGTGTKLCEFNEDSVDQATGEKGQYDKNCSDREITSCEGGYYRPAGETNACVVVGQNYYRAAGKCTGSGSNDTCMRIACPANGKTTGTTSTTSKDCYLEKLACAITYGSGQNTCHHDGTTNTTIAAYTFGCTECTVTVCNAGYYKANNKCEICPAGSFCGGTDPNNPNAPVGPQSCPANYPKSDNGISSLNQCYRDCTTDDIANSASITGRVSANNTNTCQVTTCMPGYYKANNKCEICPAGSFCGGTDPNSPNAPVGPQSCPADWSFTDGLATKKENCYRKCESYPITGGTAIPVHPKEYWPTVCEFEGLSDNGNECDIINGACQEISCRNIFELINGQCVPCNREHALSYLPRGNCMVASCEIGYHPNGQSCESNTKACHASHAVHASQTWDSTLGSFSTCTIEECEEGYHVASNACVTNEQVCAVEHGVGIKEWNTNTNSWGECVATSCDAGYTNDPSETNEHTKQCGQCKNKFSILGELAVSTYIRGCEIAACLYQGELYNLENNECIPICEVNGYEDETGTRYWDAEHKKCVRTCIEGYTPW